jgi:hypothetical protein
VRDVNPVKVDATLEVRVTGDEGRHEDEQSRNMVAKPTDKGKGRVEENGGLLGKARSEARDSSGEWDFCGKGEK